MNSEHVCQYLDELMSQVDDPNISLALITAKSTISSTETQEDHARSRVREEECELSTHGSSLPASGFCVWCQYTHNTEGVDLPNNNRKCFRDDPAVQKILEWDFDLSFDCLEEDEVPLEFTLPDRPEDQPNDLSQNGDNEDKMFVVNNHIKTELSNRLNKNKFDGWDADVTNFGDCTPRQRRIVRSSPASYFYYCNSHHTLALGTTYCLALYMERASVV